MTDPIKDLLDYIDDEYEEFKDHAEWLVTPPDRKELLKEFPECEGSDLLKTGDWKFDRFTAWGYYYAMRKTGSTHRFAECIIMRQFPIGSTEATFFQGFPLLRDQFRSQPEFDRMMAAAKRQGYTPSANDIYMPNLAKCKSDPAAFISRADGRHKIRKVCEKRGWGCDGGVSVQSRQNEPASGVALAEDIVQDVMRQSVASDPQLGTLDRQELREKVIEKHGMPPES